MVCFSFSVMGKYKPLDDFRQVVVLSQLHPFDDVPYDDFCALDGRNAFMGIFPGLVKHYSYQMVPYIVKEYPDLSEVEVITLSRKMMDGNKWRTFLLDMTFLGWTIAGAVTFGIVSILWALPYYENTKAALYLELKG